MTILLFIGCAILVVFIMKMIAQRKNQKCPKCAGRKGFKEKEMGHYANDLLHGQDLRISRYRCSNCGWRWDDVENNTPV